jgi:uncharacterized protein DUF6152
MAIPRVANSIMANKIVVFSLVIGLLAPAPLTAHHTGSTLLLEKTVTLKGVVKSWFWSNPHCLLTLEVKGDDGQVVQWVLEHQAPNTIYAEGYRKNSFTAGDAVTVTLNPVANGRPYGRIASVVLPDGTRLGNEPGSRGRGRGAAAQ